MQPIAVPQEDQDHDHVTDVDLEDSEENLIVNMAVWQPKPVQAQPEENKFFEADTDSDFSLQSDLFHMESVYSEQS